MKRIALILTLAFMNVALITFSQTINEAGGGGILHFLATYDTPEIQIQNAQEALREKLGNDEIFLKGPVIFEQGRYALISSVLRPGGEAGHLTPDPRAPGERGPAQRRDRGAPHGPCRCVRGLRAR